MTFLTLVLLDGNVNSDVFDAGLTQELLLKIPSGSVVVMDNASFHPRYDMLEAIGAHQCMAVCLPRIANLRRTQMGSNESRQKTTSLRCR